MADDLTRFGHSLIAGFPGVGKSYFTAQHDGVVDSDSSSFSWIVPGQRHPEWPQNYLRHIKGMLGDGLVVLVSTHEEVRALLADEGLSFTLVYPDPSCRVEYLVRLAQRGSPLRLIELVDANWNGWIEDLLAQKGCDHIVLGPGKYLSDAVHDLPQAPQGGS